MRIYKIAEGVVSQDSIEMVRERRPSTVQDYGAEILKQVNNADRVLDAERQQVASMTQGGSFLDDEFRANYEKEYGHLVRTLEFAHSIADLMANQDLDQWKGTTKVNRKSFDNPAGVWDYDDEEGVSEPAAAAPDVTIPRIAPEVAPEAAPEAAAEDEASVTQLQHRQKPLSSISPRTLAQSYGYQNMRAILENADLSDFDKAMKTPGIVNALQLASAVIAYKGSKKAGTVIEGVPPEVSAAKIDAKEYVRKSNGVFDKVIDYIYANADDEVKLSKFMASVAGQLSAANKPLFDFFTKKFRTASVNPFRMLRIADAAGFDIAKYRGQIKEYYSKFDVETQKVIDLNESFVHYVDLLKSAISTAYSAISTHMVNDPSTSDTLTPISDGLKWMARLVKNMEKRGDESLNEWEDVKKNGLLIMSNDEMTEFVAKNNEDYLISVADIMNFSTDIAADGKLKEITVDEAQSTTDDEPTPEEAAEDSADPTTNVENDVQLAGMKWNQLMSSLDDGTALLSAVESGIDNRNTGAKIATQNFVHIFNSLLVSQGEDTQATLAGMKERYAGQDLSWLEESVRSGVAQDYAADDYEAFKAEFAIGDEAPDPVEPEGELVEPEPEWDEVESLASIPDVSSPDDVNAALERYDYLVTIANGNRFDDFSRELSREGIVEKFIVSHLKGEDDFEQSVIAFASYSDKWRGLLERLLTDRARDFADGQANTAEEAVTNDPSGASDLMVSETAKLRELFTLAEAAYDGDANFKKEEIMAFAEAILENKDSFMAARDIAAVLGLGSGASGAPNVDNFFMQMNQHIGANILRNRAKIENDFVALIEDKEMDPRYSHMDVMNYQDDIDYLTKEVANVKAQQQEQQSQTQGQAYVSMDIATAIIEEVVEASPEREQFARQALELMSVDPRYAEMGMEDVLDMANYIVNTPPDVSAEEFAENFAESFV